MVKANLVEFSFLINLLILQRHVADILPHQGAKMDNRVMVGDESI